MQIFHHEYQLQPRQNLNSHIPAASRLAARNGALLRVQWSAHKIGYSDLFPWPELGDLPLSQQLQKLREGHPTQLMVRSLELAERDANKRQQGQSLLDDLPILKNHLSLPDLSQATVENLQAAQAQGFTTIKIKMGRDWNKEIDQWINLAKQSAVHPWRWRLDFNAQGTPEILSSVLAALPATLRANIDFIEDPFPFHPSHWAQAAETVPLALDHEISHCDWNQLQKLPSLPFQFLILKPARQSLPPLPAGFPVVFTSSMDHPVGVMHGLAVAAAFAKENPACILDCGFLTNSLYHDSPFSSQNTVRGPWIYPSNDAGVGFTELLTSLRWKVLE